MSDTLRKLRFEPAPDSDDMIVILRPKTGYQSRPWTAWAYLHEDVVAEIFGAELMQAARERVVDAKISVEVEA